MTHSKLKKNLLRAVAYAMMVCMLSVTMLGYIGNSTVVEAKSISQMEKEIAALEKKEKALAASLNNTAKKIKDEKAKQQVLEEQIKSVEEQITIYQEKIVTVTDAIAVKEAEITNKLADIETNEEFFAKRVRAMYMSSTSNSTLTTLLESKSFSQFLNTAEFLARISKSDKDLIEELSQQKKELSEQKASLEADQADLKKTKAEFEKKNKSLDSMYDNSKGSEAALKKAERDYMLQKQATAKQIAAQEKELDAAIAASKNDGAGPQGMLRWPVPASSRITSPFGYRTLFGKKEMHWGIDIGAGKGTAIVAAESGTVVTVKHSKYGYGSHVAINHGGGITTLYAHASRIDVSVGQKVKIGQTIAGVGNTGNSFGNHLHFEVRVNNAKKNPMGYVKKP